MAKMQGKIVQFGTKGYGFIEGEDGQKYFAHQKNIENGERLKVGTVVLFQAEESEKGLVANNVVLKNKAKNPQNLINNLLIVSFVLHTITIYAVFFK